MRNSLRARLVMGMVLGLVVLLAGAGIAIHELQRRQLYRAFDASLLSNVHALTALLHRGPPGLMFHTDDLTRLPGDRLHSPPLFQIWSSDPIDLPGIGPRFGNDAPGPFPGPPNAPPGHPQDHQPSWPTDAPDADTAAIATAEDSAVVYGDTRKVVRARTLESADLPRLGPADEPNPVFGSICLPNGVHGRAVTVRVELAEPGPRPHSRTDEGLAPPPTRVTVTVAAPSVEIEAQMASLSALLLGTAAGTLIVACAVAWVVVSRGLRPLHAVAADLAGLDETGLKRRFAAPAPREIEPVVAQLNGMLERLDQAFERERTLTADVAHEMRTPIAELRAIVEITLARVRSPEDYRRALDEVLDTVAALQGVIEKLLVLARLESGQTQPELEPVAIKPLIVHQWTLAHRRCHRTDLAFSNRCATEAIGLVDRGLLEVVLANVLANAVAYTPAEGEITVTSQRHNGAWSLAVANEVAEHAAPDVRRVFDRFWRADPARTRGTLNCGIGLTLVRRAMEAMGGTADARLADNRRFELTLTVTAVAAESVD